MRADRVHAAVVALALFALYAATAPRTVAVEDDSLFVLSSYYLGIEHPPGYPLFTLIGHLFTYLPVGSVAYRVHLASALFGALSCAAAWLCARALGLERLPAYLSAFALGLSPVFWSQSVIAEVYTLNTFLFLVLVYLGLRACPPGDPAALPPEKARALPWMAFVFGLSLSNHWPLMLLVAPGFLILLWPLREQILNRFGLLAFLAILGLAPYVWMVRRSWAALPISFDGPLETLPEIWFFISRAGYANIDQSVSAEWLDRVKFLRFLAGQLLLQFAVAGALLAAVGFKAQWQALGGRVSAFLTVGFLMPSVVLLMLLGFDYSTPTKHVFHVYPLPAYAVAALWLGLGFAWLAKRYALRPGQARAAGAAVMALILGVGAWINLRANYDFSTRYAQLVLQILPPDAVVFSSGEADMGPMAYFMMIENARPDVTLYQHKGLVLGNRLFHPLRIDEASHQRVLREAIEREQAPVVFTLDAYTGYAQRDRWLYIEVDKSSTDASQVTVDIPEETVRFFEEVIAEPNTSNAWIAHFQNELRRRYALLLARTLPRGKPPPPREQRHFELLAKDFYGAIGYAEGLMVHKEGYAASAVSAFLDRARELMPEDAPKGHKSRFFYLRGALRADFSQHAAATRDFETAIEIWPTPTNMAINALQDLYRHTGDSAAARELQERVQRMKAPPR
jgi:Protein of unknown function (DUF2723)